MKRLLLLTLLLPALAAAKVPVEEDILDKITDTNSPYYYTELKMRYDTGDETLTDEDYHYLYYGYAYQDSYKPLNTNPDLDKGAAARLGARPRPSRAPDARSAHLGRQRRAAARPLQPEAAQPDVPTPTAPWATGSRSAPMRTA